MQILCADNSDVSLLGLRHALHSQGFFDLGQAHSPSEIIAELAQKHYDLIISEYRFGDEELLDFVDKIRSVSPNVKILVFTFHQNPTYVARAASYQLFDFITKSSSLQKLLSSVTCASVSSPPPDSILTKATQFLLQTHPPINQLSGLTKREVQVLVQLSLGLSNREISQALVDEAWTRLSPGTELSIEPFEKFLAKARKVGFLRAKIDLSNLLWLP